MRLLKFHAAWCGPCKALSAVIESAATDITIPVVDIDIDSDPTMAAKYGIRSIPTMIIIDENNTTIKQTTGSKNREQLLEFING